MKKKPYLNFYKKYYGKPMPDCGLCYALSNEFGEWDDDSELCEHEAMDIFDNGQLTAYYGYDSTVLNEQNIMYEFTPLRQNMVLLLAAMNGEL